MSNLNICDYENLSRSLCLPLVNYNGHNNSLFHKRQKVKLPDTASLSLEMLTSHWNLPTCLLCGHLPPQSSSGCGLLGGDGDRDGPLGWRGSMFYSFCGKCCTISSAEVYLIGWN